MKRLSRKVCQNDHVFTEEELVEIKLEDEKNLRQLQRQYNNRWSTHRNDQNFGKIKKVVRILKQEKKEHDNDLTVATSSQKKKQDSEISKKIRRLIKSGENLNNRMAETKIRMKEIESQIKEVEENVKKLREAQSDDNHKQRIKNGNIKAERLKKELEVQLKHFDSVNKENENLRNEIKSLLIKREIFNNDWEKRISSLHKGKKAMLDIMAQVYVTYGKRDEYIEKLQFLRLKAQKDLTTDMEEQKKLRRILGNQQKLSEFVGTKECKRVGLPLLLKTRLLKIKNSENLLDQFKHYTKSIDKIKKNTGVSNLNGIIEKFNKQEVAKVSTVNLLIDLNKQIEQNAAAIRKDCTKCEKVQEIYSERKEQQKFTISTLKNKMEAITEEATIASQKLKEKEEKLKNLFESFNNIFKIAGCTNSPFLNFLGDNSEINEYNYMLYMEELQDRIKEMIFTAYYKQRFIDGKKRANWVIDEEKRFYQMNYMDDFVPASPCPLCVEQEMVSGVVDSLQFAKTKEEVKEYLEERLKLPDGKYRLHSVASCNHPKAREIVQKQYL